MTRTSVWVKIPKIMPQYPAIYLFPWERKGILTSQNLTKKKKKLSTSALSALPSAQKRFRFRQNVDDARQNCPKISIFFPENFAPSQ